MAARFKLDGFVGRGLEEAVLTGFVLDLLSTVLEEEVRVEEEEDDREVLAEELTGRDFFFFSSKLIKIFLLTNVAYHFRSVFHGIHFLCS